MQKRVIAYLSDWAFHEDITAEQAACLTHINYSFGLVEGGQVSIAHLKQLERLSRLKKQFPHINVNLSIGGWGADGFSQAVATEESREMLAESAMKAVQKLQLSGLDWDWEYPGSNVAGIAASENDVKNMSAFLVRMRSKLDTYEMKTGFVCEQSIAVGANRTGDYLWDEVLPSLTTVNLMTYDMGMADKAGHMTNLNPCKNAAYSVRESVQDFVLAGVLKEKLLIGAAFYFHAFEGISCPGPLGMPYSRKAHNIGHDKLDSGWQYCWDTEALAAYYLKEGTLLSGDDERSLDEKRLYIHQEGLGGVIIWELNHDRKNLLLPHLAKN